MNVAVTTDLEKEGLEGWIVPFFEDDLSGPGADLDGKLDNVIRQAVESKEFEPKGGKTFWVRPMGRLPVARIVAVGLGKREKMRPVDVLRAYAVGGRALRDAGCRRIGAVLAGHVEQKPDFDAACAERTGQTIAEGVITGAYEFDRYKSSEEPPKQLTELFISVPENWRDAFARGAEQGAVIAAAANFTRDLANEVPSVATPAHMAGVAQTFDRDRFTVEVLDEVALAERGLEAILSVGRGSANPPRIVSVSYRGGADGDAPYLVVGKGITFDSGGLSLKPAASMEEMKFDKSGACAVLGVMRAVADLRLPLNVVGVLGLAENLPGPTAYKPGDIIRSGAGKTIEVLNTDAEGRVVLADALHYACGMKPAAIVDLATLTGGCVVALGDVASGVMGTDEKLVRSLIESGEATGERLWELPLWPEYDEKVKSEVADVKNLGERAGGTSLASAIAGGSFLKAFVSEGCPWAHLDIAGTAWGGKKPYRGAGATGVGVRLVVEWLRSVASGRGIGSSGG